mmetsp:Transcript_47133/g.100232  ORF Transcript_47133/g.100232 Transcript_47133/m.100232 type:complete len:348 (-) Transcript_47133:291-1334(-)
MDLPYRLVLARHGLAVGGVLEPEFVSVLEEVMEVISRGEVAGLCLRRPGRSGAYVLGRPEGIRTGLKVRVTAAAGPDVHALARHPQPDRLLLSIQPILSFGVGMDGRVPDQLDALPHHGIGVVPPPTLCDAFRTRLKDQRRRHNLRGHAILPRSKVGHVAYLHRPQKVPRERLVGIHEYRHVVGPHPVLVPPALHGVPLQYFPGISPLADLVIWHGDVVVHGHFRPGSEQLVQLVLPARARAEPKPAWRSAGEGGVGLDECHCVEYVVRLRADGRQYLERIVRDERSHEQTPPPRVRGEGVPIGLASGLLPRQVDLVVVQQPRLSRGPRPLDRLISRNLYLVTVVAE